MNIHQASEVGDVDAVRALLATGVSPNGFDENGQTPLLIASLEGRVEVIRALLRAGADANLGDESEFRTPLMHAAIAGHADIAKLLLDFGADPNATDDYGDTALHRAVGRRNLEIMILLLAHGANPELRDELGRTCREIAEEGGSECIDILAVLRKHEIAHTQPN